MRQCMDADNLHRRLKKVIGQVKAIDRMVDEDHTIANFTKAVERFSHIV
ncbi:MAG: metal-sensing transcriptional repressor [Dialister sp.]|nr:metal-sensing transcriptional repressor [Dialister sp.]